MRQRLIELLQTVPTDPEGNRNVGVIADYLLENGVVVWNNELKCGELIELKSESEALNRIALQLEVLNRINSDFDYYEHCLKIAKKSIEEQQPEIKKDNGWISVNEDEKPRHLQECLIAYVFGDDDSDRHFYGVERYNAFEGNGLVDRPHFSNEGTEGMRVTHWIPIPKLPNFENECEIVGNVHDNPDLLEGSE